MSNLGQTEIKKGAVKYTAPFLKVQGYSFNSK